MLLLARGLFRLKLCRWLALQRKVILHLWFATVCVQEKPLKLSIQHERLLEKSTRWLLTVRGEREQQTGRRMISEQHSEKAAVSVGAATGYDKLRVFLYADAVQTIKKPQCLWQKHFILTLIVADLPLSKVCSAVSFVQTSLHSLTRTRDFESAVRTSQTPLWQAGRIKFVTLLLCWVTVRRKTFPPCRFCSFSTTIKYQSTLS